MDNILELVEMINDDFEWSMKTTSIFENDGVENPETIAFLKGVKFCTVRYLDILERDAKLSDTSEPEVTYVDISKVNEEEVK